VKIWFITGASRGFGRIWAEAALSRGDKVAATARKLADVADLTERFSDAALTLALDVTDPEQVGQVVAQAHAHFGRLDVILNNAGYALVGTVEEASEADVRALFDTNYFGMLRVIQAALPLLRKQGSGHILGVSECGSWWCRSSASIAPPNGPSKRSTKAWRKRSKASQGTSKASQLAQTLISCPQYVPRPLVVGCA